MLPISYNIAWLYHCLFHICKVLTDNLPAGMWRPASLYRSMEVLLYIPLHFVHMRVYGHPDQQSGEKRGGKYLLCLNGSYATVVYSRQVLYRLCYVMYDTAQFGLPMPKT